MLQAVVNKFLAMDPLLDLSDLAGKWIYIACTDFPQLNVYFTVEKQCLLFSSSLPDHVDTTISGTLKDLLHFAITKQRAHLQVSGNMDVAQVCEQIFVKLDIDWEEELSKYTGDVVAFTAMQTLREIKQYTIYANDSMSDMLSEYLQEESGLLPTPYEINAFMQEVDDLRMLVDRLEAKVKLYEIS